MNNIKLKKTNNFKKFKIDGIPSYQELHLNQLKKFEKLKKQGKKQEVEEQESSYWLNSYPLLFKYEESKTEEEKNENLIEYLRSIERVDLMNKLIDIRQKILLKCPCGTAKEIVYIDNYFSCSDCGLVLYEDTISHTISFKEYQELDYNNQYYYKRIVHFQECLNRVQAKENTTVPEKVYNCIDEELKKNRVNVTEITISVIKMWLKKNNLNKYIENIYTIFYNVTGQKVIIPYEIEEKMKEMFLQIQESFEKNKGNRKNFLNVNYCIWQFLNLLNYQDLQVHFPLLKSREKMQEHHVIWKKICHDMDWDFFECA